MQPMRYCPNLRFGLQYPCNSAPSSSLAVLGRHIRLVCLDLVLRLLLSPTRGACRGPLCQRLVRIIPVTLSATVGIVSTDRASARYIFLHLMILPMQGSFFVFPAKSFSKILTLFSFIIYNEDKSRSVEITAGRTTRVCP